MKANTRKKAATLLVVALGLGAAPEGFAENGKTLPEDGILKLKSGGRTVEFQLDLTRVFLEDPRGGQPEPRVLEKPATVSEFPAVVSALEKSTGKHVLPVLLERHHPRPEAALQLLTREVLVKLKPGAPLNDIATAAAGGKEKPPPYRQVEKNTIALEFPSAFAALRGLTELRKTPEVVSAEPLLKRRMLQPGR